MKVLRASLPDRSAQLRLAYGTAEDNMDDTKEGWNI